MEEWGTGLGISEIKEILDGLKLVDEIIQGDLKWFNKHCIAKKSDSITLVKELINEVQKKFQEIQEKKCHVDKIFQMLPILKLSW